MTPRRSRWGWWFGDLGDAPGEALASSHAGAPEVIRFGGSLLERAEWPELAGLLLEPPFGGGPALPMTLVVGGGGIVEGLRGIDRTRPLDQSLVHRLAIDGMGKRSRRANVACPNSALRLFCDSDNPSSSLMSAPAQNDFGPAPVINNARASLPATSSKARPRSRNSPRLSALSASGRFSVIKANSSTRVN